jgi:proton glutamate symport protein
MFRYTNYVMLFAPLGVFGAMAATIGDKGLRVLLNLGKLVVTLYATQMFFVVVVLGTVTAIARIPCAALSAGCVAIPIAYSTASSEAALPLALEKHAGSECRNASRHFRPPIQLQPRWLTLYLALASMFVAQAAGIISFRYGHHDAYADADQ